jgi:hypothetical protein
MQLLTATGGICHFAGLGEAIFRVRGFSMLTFPVTLTKVTEVSYLISSNSRPSNQTGLSGSSLYR